jgi:hypothetical protein
MVIMGTLPKRVYLVKLLIISTGEDVAGCLGKLHLNQKNDLSERLPQFDKFFAGENLKLLLCGNFVGILLIFLITNCLNFHVVHEGFKNNNLAILKKFWQQPFKYVRGKFPINFGVGSLLSALFRLPCQYSCRSFYNTI